MLAFDIQSGKLLSQSMNLIFADKPYSYCLSGSIGGEPIIETSLTDKRVKQERGETVVTGRFAKLGIELTQILRNVENHLEEIITLKNSGTQPVTLNQIELGFVADLDKRPGWRLCAIPFRVQLDGSVHDYTTDSLITIASRGGLRNAFYTDRSRPEPPLVEWGSLRSEAWAWGPGDCGLVIIKYNNTAIELSVASPRRQGATNILRFGGVGFSLYGEPSTAHYLEPGQQVTFGATLYIPYKGGLNEAYKCYRDFLDSRGHTFPKDYDPPVHWNVLFDIGWYHSDREKLKRYYTREALFREAEKARACGCEALYLDPGWEVAEGLTLWDEERLGPISDFVKKLKEEYGLRLAFRTILRCYTDYWPHEYLVQHDPHNPARGPIDFGNKKLWELCLCNRSFWKEKLKRILNIARHGVCFIMFDEMDWRGPCYDPKHGHAVPTTPLDHAMAVYNLAREVRKRCPDLLIEVHDPIWPWRGSIYMPTYFQQGFGDRGAYDENWGFEYMWDCLNDLKSGRALALYYYSLGCNIPLYLHINMAADNDNCVFFWWAASTVRHLGIGGKFSHRTIEPIGGLRPFDPEKRFAAYQNQMRIYKRLKPYFVRGTFHGIAENIHLHTLPGKKGGVVNVFNLTEVEKEIQFFIPKELLGGINLPVKGAEAKWNTHGVELRLKLKGLCPALIYIGDAAQEVKSTVATGDGGQKGT